MNICMHSSDKAGAAFAFKFSKLQYHDLLFDDLFPHILVSQGSLDWVAYVAPVVRRNGEAPSQIWPSFKGSDLVLKGSSLTSDANLPQVIEEYRTDS